jgi:HEAT repeat protein
LAGHQGLSQGKYFEELLRFGVRYGATAVPYLQALLSNSDWQVRAAVLRALGATNSLEAQVILKQTIRPDAVLEDAAQATLSLGEMEDPTITAWLRGRWQSVPEGDLKRCLLDTLASRPYAQTSDFFPALLQGSSLDSETRASVLSNLGFHQEAPLSLLTPFLASPDEILRGGAYDALASRPEARLGQHLIRLSGQENDASLRRKAYEAAGHQLDITPMQMAAVASREPDPAARLRAERAWGVAVGRSSNLEDQRRFDIEAVPNLVTHALKNPDAGEQRAALQALAFAGTPGAKAGLVEIARISRSPRLAKLAASLAEKIP